MQLVFIDDPARLPEVPPGHVVVATELDVEVAAQSEGRELLPFWGHVDSLALEVDGESTYAPLTQACESLGSVLGPDASAHWHLREIKVVVDGVRGRWLAARELVAAHAPTEVTLMLGEGTLAYDVLAHGLPTLGIHVRPETYPAPPQARGGRAPRLRSMLSWHLRPPQRTGSPLVLCADALYGISPIAEALRARGSDVRLLLPAPERTLDVVLPEVALHAFGELFAVGGVDLAAVGVPRVSDILRRGLPASVAAYRGARRTLRRLRPDAVLGSAYEAPRSKAIAAAAHAEAVPVFVSRHGEMGIRRNTYGTYQDLDAVDVALCWGEWEARQVTAFAHRRVQPVVVGAPSIEMERAPSRASIRAELGFSESEIVVLYVLAAFGDGTWIASRRSPNASAYLRHRSTVLRALTALPGITPVLKMPSAPPGEILSAWLRTTAPNALLVSGRPYSELVHLADAVVIDFPSTTLVQALRGSARIFIPDHPVMDWMPDVREHLTKHGVVFVEPVDLRERLAAELAQGQLAGPHSYPQEALEPLVASGPGAAADRAADALLRIVAENR